MEGSIYGNDPLYCQQIKGFSVPESLSDFEKVLLPQVPA